MESIDVGKLRDAFKVLDFSGKLLKPVESSGDGAQVDQEGDLQEKLLQLKTITAFLGSTLYKQYKPLEDMDELAELLYQQLNLLDE